MSEVVTTAAPAPAAPSPAAPAPAEGEQPAQNTAEQAPATAPEGDKPDTDESPDKQRGSRRFERRLNRAFKEAAEAKARAELYEKQLQEFKAKSAPEADPSAPRLEQYDDIEKYAQAKAKFEADKVLRDHQTKQQTEAQKQAQAKLTESWEVAAERGETKYPDFADVVGDLKPDAPWSAAVMRVENADDVAYHLGKDLKEARRIIALPPFEQLIEIGRLSAKLAAEPPKAKTPSKAPAPITPLKGAAPVVSDVPSDSDDMKAWIAKRQKQVHGKRG
jgi:hypothetical protein